MTFSCTSASFVLLIVYSFSLLHKLSIKNLSGLISGLLYRWLLAPTSNRTELYILFACQRGHEPFGTCYPAPHFISEYLNHEPHQRRWQLRIHLENECNVLYICVWKLLLTERILWGIDRLLWRRMPTSTWKLQLSEYADNQHNWFMWCYSNE